MTHLVTPNHPSFSQNFPKIPGYKITEKLYLGSRTIVYRAIEISQHRSVIIKLLRREYPSFNELVQFRNQYTITKNLSIPGIVKPFSLNPFGSGYALVMEDHAAIALNQYIQQHSLEIIEVLEIGIKIAEILHNLYQNRVIHKDIKPANILIHSESKQVKVIDFSIASLLPKETQEIQNSNSLEGTLAYLAPEQSGRMNRAIDYRADFYAFGVTLYQLLSGKLPFDSNDPLELIHCHIAKIPVAVDKINPNIPKIVADIVAKLMAKNAENRYQSALGLKHDLECCLTQLKYTEKIVNFELGQQDLSDRFLIPEKLYGRETEVQKLLEAFDRVAKGASELMLLAGFSGIGKTAVINEVHKPIVRQRGYFIHGKFDQFNRNIPLSAFVQALRDLMRQLLSEPDQQLAQWKNKILAAVGDNGQVLIEVIPELEKIIGQQPPVPQLSGTAAQNRFNLLFQKFIGVFTTKDHPLVIFLDDLQWADLASLKLMKLLMNDSQYLLMLGAYRDNEVSPVHPLMMSVDELLKNQVTVNTITLTPLRLEDTNHLVAETLNCALELALPLTELIQRKTSCNPFFITQFLKALYEEGYIYFNRDCRYWECDIAQITALALTDDVVEFMATQLQKLPRDTQQALKLAACVGNQFDLETLAIISEQSPVDTAMVLWKALEEGLILPTSQVYKFFQEQDHQDRVEIENAINPSYRFLHDRIQQAAVSLIAEEHRQQTHFEIGQLLLNSTPSEELESKIFDIVNHLNAAIELMGEQPLKYELARLNLMAGKKAKKSNAHATAVKHLSLGIELLPRQSWQSHYELTFALYRECGECEYLRGNFESSQQFLDTAFQQAIADLDQAEIYSIVMNLYMTLGDDFQKGINAGLEGLELLGLTIPREDDKLKQMLAADLQTVQQHLAEIEIAQLYNNPVQTDPKQNFIMRLLVDIWSLSYLDANADLLNLTVLKIVLFSLQHGNTSLSAFGYVSYAMNLGVEQDYKTAYKLARVALRLNEKFNRTDLIGKVNNLFCHAINPYNKPLVTNLPLYQESYHRCMECGDLTYGVWALFFGIWTRLEIGENLQEIEKEAEKYLNSVEEVGDLNILYSFRGLQRVIRNLQKKVEYPLSLNDDVFNEAECLSKWRENNFDHGLNLFHYLKGQLLYTYEQYEEALLTFEAVEDKVAANMGVFSVTKYYFYYLLVLTAIYPHVSEPHQVAYWQTIKRHQTQIQTWAQSCPENFQHQFLLVSAEIARIRYRRLEAIDLYEQAIESAQLSQFIHHEALANELTAKFYLDWGKEKIAALYFQQAYYCYVKWGAKAKVVDLETRYPSLLTGILQQQYTPLSTMETVLDPYTLTAFETGSSSGSLSEGSSIWATLDLAMVLKVSQTLSGEIELDKLLATLLRTVLENAGADRATLLMPYENQWFIQAVATVERPVEVRSIPLSSFKEISQTLVNIVKRGLEPIVMMDASTHPLLTTDVYVIQHQPKSLLCAPILQQGKLVAILYLENRVTAGVFTRDRVELLQLLTSQAAISLENARLYQKIENYSHTLEVEVERKTQALNQKNQDLEQALRNLQQTQAQLIHTEKMSSLGQMVAGIAHEINNPISFIKGNLNCLENYLQDLMSLVEVYQAEYPAHNPSIQSKIEDIDLDFMFEDVIKILKSMNVGSNRIKQIILSLRNFSRLDESPLKEVDIHSGIDSTLLLVQHRLNATNNYPEVRVIQDYGDLPLITCYPSQLNQVFLSIINNALDAIQENPECSQHPEIRIRTEALDQEWVQIAIANTDSTIPEEIQKQIFDPFFTTKPIGKGTGLGMSMSYQIVVEKHQGTLECVSSPETGTEFVIRIPIQQYLPT